MPHDGAPGGGRAVKIHGDCLQYRDTASCLYNFMVVRIRVSETTSHQDMVFGLARSK
jgi:hypothetical protein